MCSLPVHYSSPNPTLALSARGNKQIGKERGCTVTVTGICTALFCYNRGAGNKDGKACLHIIGLRCCLTLCTPDPSIL